MEHHRCVPKGTLSLVASMARRREGAQPGVRSREGASTSAELVEDRGPRSGARQRAASGETCRGMGAEESASSARKRRREGRESRGGTSAATDRDSAN